MKTMGLALAAAMGILSATAQAAPRCTVEPPKYPKVAKSDWASGTSVVDITVGADGRVEAARLSQSSGNPQLDAAAIESAAAASCAAGGHVTLPQTYNFEMITAEQYWQKEQERRR